MSQSKKTTTSTFCIECGKKIRLGKFDSPQDKHVQYHMHARCWDAMDYFDVDGSLARPMYDWKTGEMLFYS